MATAPPLPADRGRASAVRCFPPDCGRHRNAAQPPRHPDSFTAYHPLPNPSVRAATKTPSPPRRPLTAARFHGTGGPDRGWGNGSVAKIKAPAAAAVAARRASAVRRYPPGCGRGVAVPKPEALVGEGAADASKLQASVSNNAAKAIAGDRKVLLRESTLDHGESDSNGGGKSGGDGGGAQEKCGGRPWIVTGLMLVPFLPWAQHGRRSQQRWRHV